MRKTTTDHQQFPGFAPASENWFKQPSEVIAQLPRFKTLAELKVVLYVTRHTYGYGDESKRISLDEFEYGRKRRNGTRIDNGVGMDRKGILRGIKAAKEHGFLEVEKDEKDPARIRKYYSLKFRGGTVPPPPVAECHPRGGNIPPRTEIEPTDRTLKNNNAKTGDSLPDDHAPPDQDAAPPRVVVSLIQDLVSCGMPRGVAESLVGEYEEARIRRHIAAFHQQQKHRTDAPLTFRWLIKAIKKNWDHPEIKSGWLTAHEVAAHAKKHGLPARHPSHYTHNGKTGPKARWKVAL